MNKKKIVENMGLAALFNAENNIFFPCAVTTLFQILFLFNYTVFITNEMANFNEFLWEPWCWNFIVIFPNSCLILVTGLNKG
jgi:hypothetical protein